MQPQGASLVNAAYFEQLTADVNAIDGCAALQALVNAAMGTLQAEVTAIEGQIASLLPLITLPTNLGQVISWIAAFATPLVKPYENYITQLAQTTAAIAQLTQAIEAAAKRLEHCTITVPPIKVA